MNKKQDFDPVALTKATEQHEENITDHAERIEAIEKRLSTPTEIAALLETASDDSKKLDKLFAKIFTSMLQDESCNKDIRESITNIVNKTDRNVYYLTLRRWGKIIGAVSLFFLGIIATLITDWARKKIGLN